MNEKPEVDVVATQEEVLVAVDAWDAQEVRKFALDMATRGEAADWYDPAKITERAAVFANFIIIIIGTK